MCGIAGYTGAQRPGLLSAMIERVAHRGPDGEGRHEEPGISLAARRLAIVDRAEGSQPRSDESGTCWVVQNGEVYNHRALATQLTASGHRFATRSDTEAIVHLWEEKGPAALSMLEGMFAIALWDRAGGTLTLVRDRLGEKPLYYTIRNGELYFASEVKSLLAVPGVEAAVDPAALDEYLTLQYVTGERTLFRGISKLPPGHRLTFHRGSARVERWWTPPPVSARELTAVEVRELLSQSVAARLPDEVPWGCFLSSGVDSGAVAAVMARHAAGRLRTFTVGYDVPGAVDERRGAAELAQALSAEHSELVLAVPGVADLLEMTWHLDQPLANAATLALFELSRVARRSVTVVLTGEGADELFGGYGKYTYPRLAMKLGAAGAPLARVLARLPSRGRVAHLAKLGKVLAIPDADAQFASLNSVFDDAARAALAPGAEHRPAAQRVGDRCGAATSSILDRMMRFDLLGYLPEDNLMKVDRATMAHGLEARAPYLDRELVERALASPAESRAGWVNPKSLLREAVRPWLPARVFSRRKQAFELPVGTWLAREWAALTDAVLAPAYLARQRVFASDAAARVRHEGTPRQLWTLVAFQLWYLRFVEERAAADAVLAPALDPARGAH